MAEILSEDEMKIVIMAFVGQRTRLGGSATKEEAASVVAACEDMRIAATCLQLILDGTLVPDWDGNQITFQHASNLDQPPVANKRGLRLAPK